MVMKYFVFFFLALSFLAPQSGKTVEIMAFGDSITQGVNYIMSPGQGRRVGGYEPHLEMLFSVVGRSANVYNWGLGGETTQQALDGWKWKCEIDLATGEEVCVKVFSRTIGSALAAQGGAHYFLLMEGTNDAFTITLTPWKTASNIGRMMDLAMTYSMEPIVATITPDERGLDKQINLRNSLIQLEAAKRGVTVVDMYNRLLGNWGAYVSSDNLHPNKYGYKAMAREWFRPFYNIHLTTGTVDVYSNSPISLLTVFKGFAKANGKVFEVSFQYGLDKSMNNVVSVDPPTGDASAGLAVRAEVSGLQFETEYYYRVVSTLDGMTFVGEIESFITPEKVVTLPWLSLLLDD